MKRQVKMKHSLLVSIVFPVLTSACNQKDNDSLAIGAEYIFSEAYQNQWKGLPDHWRWENGILTGETTEANPIK